MKLGSRASSVSSPGGSREINHEDNRRDTRGLGREFVERKKYLNELYQQTTGSFLAFFGVSSIQLLSVDSTGTGTPYITFF